MGLTVRPLHEWHEDHGDVLWWLWPIAQAPWVGTPLDLGRTVSFEVTVQIGLDLFEVEPKAVGDTGGWPWRDADEDTLARLWWTPLPDCDQIDEAISMTFAPPPTPLEDDQPSAQVAA